MKKIIGIGTDIVNIERIAYLFEKYNDAFLAKNFHEEEIACFDDLLESKKIGYLAKRFAGKEAVSKAFGRGIGTELAFKDIAVLNNELGSPFVRIDIEKMADINDYDIHITLSDDQPFAIAFVIISK